VNLRPALHRTAALLAAALAATAAPTAAVAELPPRTVAAALALATEAAQALAPPHARVLASAGALDPRLKLARCESVQPYLAAGSPPWGRTRVGLRCTRGSTRWNVFLPVTVQVLAPALVSSANLPAGSRLDASQLVLAEVDWAAAAAPPFTAAQALSGRVLARPVATGATLRSSDLQPRVWFAPGDTVHISARGRGFTISAEGRALTSGREGHPARVRTESGRVVVGRPVGERRVELKL
jgi:flagella basal body P-ring formation protein FlgA